MKKNNPSTENIQEWWDLMVSKGADYPSPAMERGIYKLHARKHGVKQRLGQKSLGTTEKRIALHAIEMLLINSSDTSPAFVVKKYLDHLTKKIEACKNKEDHLRFVQPRIKTAKTNYSRLKCHLLPFCNKYRISDVRELYQRENVGEFLNYLDETVAESATCVSIVRTTKAFLHWYDRLSKNNLATLDFEDSIKKHNQVFAHKIRKVKTFLNNDDVLKIIDSTSGDPELDARILAHLVGGLRFNEIGGLRWCDLREKEGHLIVKNAKGGVARYAQYPKCLREAFSKIRKTRRKKIMPGDFVFTYGNFSKINKRIQSYIQEICGASGKDFGSNCLRRSGCHSINMAHPGLGDKQLGHANTSRITDTYYCDRTDFSDVNAYWDEICDELANTNKSPIGEADLAPYADKIILIQATTEKNSPIPNVEVRLSSML